MNLATMPGCGDAETWGRVTSQRDPRAPEFDDDEAMEMRCARDDIRNALRRFDAALDRNDFDACRAALAEIHEATEGSEL